MKANLQNLMRMQEKLYEDGLNGHKQEFIKPMMDS